MNAGSESDLASPQWLQMLQKEINSEGKYTFRAPLALFCDQNFQKHLQQRQEKYRAGGLSPVQWQQVFSLGCWSVPLWA